MSDNDKSTTMKQYFRCMDTADFETSAAMFADDAVYVRPPYTPGQGAFDSSGPTQFEGLAAIREFWRQRGRRNTRHVIGVESATDREWFAEGQVSVDDGDPRLFLSHVTFDDSGKIQRFVAVR